MLILEYSVYTGILNIDNFSINETIGSKTIIYYNILNKYIKRYMFKDESIQYQTFRFLVILNTND